LDQRIITALIKLPRQKPTNKNSIPGKTPILTQKQTLVSTLLAHLVYQKQKSKAFYGKQIQFPFVPQSVVLLQADDGQSEGKVPAHLFAASV